MWCICIISEFRTVWQISNLVSKELEAHDFSRVSVHLKRRFNTYNENNKPKLKNKLDYIDKVLNKIPELYEIACKLYENDVKELVKEMYGIV